MAAAPTRQGRRRTGQGSSTAAGVGAVQDKDYGRRVGLTSATHRASVRSDTGKVSHHSNTGDPLQGVDDP